MGKKSPEDQVGCFLEARAGRDGQALGYLIFIFCPFLGSRVVGSVESQVSATADGNKKLFDLPAKPDLRDLDVYLF